MGKVWSWKSEKGEQKEKTVTELLQGIADEICENYCKYPEKCAAEKSDPDEAEDLLYLNYCTNCPMSRV